MMEYNGGALKPIELSRQIIPDRAANPFSGGANGSSSKSGEMLALLGAETCIGESAVGEPCTCFALNDLKRVKRQVFESRNDRPCRRC